MPQVAFTPALARYIESARVTASGDTVGAVLAAVFSERPRLRGYVLDEQSHLRRHVAIFLNGTLMARERALDAPVAPDDEVLVMQALSGG